MTEAQRRSRIIAELNDDFRLRGDFHSLEFALSFGFGDNGAREIIQMVRDFNDFPEDTTRSSGSFEFAGRRLRWKISYYDAVSYFQHLDDYETPFLSSDPSDPVRTVRHLMVNEEDEEPTDDDENPTDDDGDEA